jgi:ABC-type glutathione transport system ATPase component
MVAWELNVSDGNLWAWLAPALALWLGVVGTVGLGRRRETFVPLQREPWRGLPASPSPDRLEVRGLRLAVGDKTLVSDGNWSVGRGELVALVGPSGSGKSLTVRAALGLLPSGIVQVGGEVRLVRDGEVQVLTMEAHFEGCRGRELGLVDQDARASLDPTRTVGAQVAEAARLSGHPPDPLPPLRRAGFADPASVAQMYPHTLSGGMAQRVAIALVLARGSRYLLADECTSGLDASLQQEVLQELRRLKEEGFGILLVTHDLRILPGLADRIVVMEGGRTDEMAATLSELRGAGARLCADTRRIAGGIL